MIDPDVRAEIDRYVRLAVDNELRARQEADRRLLTNVRSAVIMVARAIESWMGEPSRGRPNGPA